MTSTHRLTNCITLKFYHVLNSRKLINCNSIHDLQIINCRELTSAIWKFFTKFKKQLIIPQSECLVGHFYTIEKYSLISPKKFWHCYKLISIIAKLRKSPKISQWFADPSISKSLHWIFHLEYYLRGKFKPKSLHSRNSSSFFFCR